ncbi:hypothetical protein RJ639_018937 [Escallonia herrerae]|uniref:PI4-kinase N-terminal domain-containing protein n=1 Tax=Escallonia herrerae TaxID=1293975 RepID=A0AA88V8P0_9ASTE|nr:hypothetical protein RJ639_018937 [Escallonia herrerae]
MLTTTRAIPDLTKVEPFNGLNFKRWQSKLLLILDIAKVDFVLTIPKPTLKEDADPKDFEKEFSIWETSNKICKGMILNFLSNELYDVCCSYAHASDIWDALNKKYVVEDAVIITLNNVGALDSGCVLVVSSVKWLEDELELNAHHNPGSRLGSEDEKVAVSQRTALSAALGGRVEVAAMSTICSEYEHKDGLYL